LAAHPITGVPAIARIPTTTGKQATAGMLATARVSAATGKPALSKGHQ